MKEPNKWKIYEERKKELKKLGLTPEEYHKRKLDLVKELGLWLK